LLEDNRDFRLRLSNPVPRLVGPIVFVQARFQHRFFAWRADACQPENALEWALWLQNGSSNPLFAAKCGQPGRWQKFREAVPDSCHRRGEFHHGCTFRVIV